MQLNSSVRAKVPCGCRAKSRRNLLEVGSLNCPHFSYQSRRKKTCSDPSPGCLDTLPCAPSVPGTNAPPVALQPVPARLTQE